MPAKTKHQKGPWITDRFDHCIIVCNPASTRAELAKRRIPELQALFPAGTVTVVQTSPKGRHANKEIPYAHATKLGSRTLLAIIAGDGTINILIDALVHDRRLTKEMRQTVVLPLWGGNGNDLANMLNGPRRRISIKRVLSDGRIVSIHPLHCEISDPAGQTESYNAACYATFGASAFTASWLDGANHRKRLIHRLPGAKFTHEFIMVLYAMTKAPRFTVDDGTSVKPIYEQFFINGSRFAKIKGLPLSLTDKTFYRSTVERKRASAIMYHIIELIRKGSTSKVADDGDISFVVHEPVWAQFDGEVVRLSAGTTVRIRLSRQPFYALSTLLQTTTATLPRSSVQRELS
jgi:diacylglycerol kinase family enzyme